MKILKFCHVLQLSLVFFIGDATITKATDESPATLDRPAPIQAVVIRINPETASKIKIGMTKQEVENIMGRPPGNYATQRVEVMDVANTIAGRRSEVWWVGNDFAIVVRYDVNDKVDASRCCEVYPHPE